MNNKIYIFIGSKKDFESFLDEKIAADEDITYFMDLIKDYNANLRQQHAYLHGIIDVKNLIVHADDYASVFEHVIQNFISSQILLNKIMVKIFGCRNSSPSSSPTLLHRQFHDAPHRE